MTQDYFVYMCRYSKEKFVIYAIRLDDIKKNDISYKAIDIGKIFDVKVYSDNYSVKEANYKDVKLVSKWINRSNVI